MSVTKAVTITGTTEHINGFIGEDNNDIFLTSIKSEQKLYIIRNILIQEHPETTARPDLENFIDRYREVLKTLFREPQNHKCVSLNRGVPPMLMRDVMQCEPLRVFIPKENGGWGGEVSHCLSMLEASSYESLPLSLMMGINGALFIQPVSRYADPRVRVGIFNRFIEDKAMGGLMITEPDYGSDALHMQTSYYQEQDGHRLEGTKHWAGLTGWADYWLLTARRKNKDGTLGRDVDFFIHDARNPGIHVEEYFENLGLYMLPYGRNRIDAYVPENFRLQPPSTGIKLMLDMLHRSRLQFPGMAMGFLRRIVDDSLDHVKTRHVGGKSLFDYDQVSERIVRMQSWFTTCAAMCRFTSHNAAIIKDLSLEDVTANSIKSVITDMMQDAAQSFLQLVGAKGYRLDHMAGRSIIDSRPFQIFEGSNDILYQQIAESVLKKMRKAKQTSLYRFMKEYDLTGKAAIFLRDIADFTVDYNTLNQRRHVILGKMLGYAVSLNMVIELGEQGFSSHLIQNAADVLTVEMHSLLASFHGNRDTLPVESIDQADDWFAFV